MENPAVWAAHVLAGGGWVSEVTVENTNLFSCRVRVQALYGMSWSLPIAIQGKQGNSWEGELGPKEAITLTLSRNGDMVAGYLQVDGGSYIAPFTGIRGIAVRTNTLTGEKFTDFLSRPAEKLEYKVEYGPDVDVVDTGIAIMNPPQYPTNTSGVVRFTLLDEEGRIIAEEVRTRYFAGAQDAFFLSALFAGNPDWQVLVARLYAHGLVFRGSIVIAHGQGIVGTSVIYDGSIIRATKPAS
jgi:hypothetical protein